MQRLKVIVVIILVLIVGIPATIAPLIFFLWLDGNFDDWIADITETGKYTNKRIERLYSIDLRVAQTAYNVKRYDLAIPYFESAINISDTDTTLNGVNLYQYADCLEKTGEIKKSKLYFHNRHSTNSVNFILTICSWMNCVHEGIRKIIERRYKKQLE